MFRGFISVSLRDGVMQADDAVFAARVPIETGLVRRTRRLSVVVSVGRLETPIISRSTAFTMTTRSVMILKCLLLT